MSTSQYVRPSDACKQIGIGKSTLWAWVATRHDFPKPIRLSARCTVFDSAALDAYVKSAGQSKGA